MRDKRSAAPGEESDHGCFPPETLESTLGASRSRSRSRGTPHTGLLYAAFRFHRWLHASDVMCSLKYPVLPRSHAPFFPLA